MAPQASGERATITDTASSLTVATAWLDEAQVASVVRSCVDPSE